MNTYPSRRTKIVATLGPATDTPEALRALIGAGMDVARLNLSHSTHAEHARRVAMVRAEAAQAGRSVGILMDLQGPKIRTGSLVGDQPVELRAGQRITITTAPVEGTAERVSTTYEALPHDVQPGDRVLVSDGLIELRVLEASGAEVACEVVYGGTLRAHQGINLPGVQVSASSLTPKDAEDLRFGLCQGVDYVALSFVRQPSDVVSLKDLIASLGANTPVISKQEKPEALDHLDGILAVSDGVMVARGDLGVEMPPERVPAAQKSIIRAANRAAIPVITATQMLESMITSPQPTRAEVSDVANAILDGSDAVMLSGETAIGRYPLRAVEFMARIAADIEACAARDQGCGRPPTRSLPRRAPSRRPSGRPSPLSGGRSPSAPSAWSPVPAAARGWCLTIGPRRRSGLHARGGDVPAPEPPVGGAADPHGLCEQRRGLLPAGPVHPDRSRVCQRGGHGGGHRWAPDRPGRTHQLYQDPGGCGRPRLSRHGPRGAKGRLPPPRLGRREPPF